MASPTPVSWRDAGRWLFLLAAPGVLWLGAASFCLAEACRPPAFDLGGLGLAAAGQGAVADALFRLLTWAGSVVVLGPLAVLHACCAWRLRPGRQALFLPLALAGATALAYATKYLVARERPSANALIEMPVDFSFPSAHALQVSTFVVAWLLAPLARPARWPGIVAGCLLVASVSWSRLHLQVHYPSDILFGLAAGILWSVSLRQLPIWRSTP